MDDEPFEATFLLTRKPPPPEQPAFTCACCDRETKPDPWRPHIHRPPVCAACVTHWSYCRRPVGITRGDYRNLNRLEAVLKRLEWEIINGKRRWG